VGFALSQPLIHWSYECEEGSIPFTRSTSPPFILNSLPLLYSSADSDSHNGFNGLHLRSDAYERKFTNSNVTKIVDSK